MKRVAVDCTTPRVASFSDTKVATESRFLPRTIVAAAHEVAGHHLVETGNPFRNPVEPAFALRDNGDLDQGLDLVLGHRLGIDDRPPAEQHLLLLQLRECVLNLLLGHAQHGSHGLRSDRFPFQE